MSEPLQSELKYALKAAIKAAKIIAKQYNQSYKIIEKSFDQPVTDADFAANRIIKEILTKHFPDDAWLSEEDVAEIERFDKKRIWVIDPLDGTKEFINKNPEFAVSIALVEDGQPILGVICNPITKEVFSAVKNHGAFYNNEPIHAKTHDPQSKPSLFVSVSEHKRGEWENYKDDFEITTRGGCAYKMVGIAMGKADGTFTLSHKNEWDCCAGHIIIEEAGGIVCHLDGSPITYNNPITSLPGLIYCNCEEMKEKILDVIPS